MSDPLPSRKPNADEVSLLQRLAEEAGGLAADWTDGLSVSDMDDGGMGSLRLLPRGRHSRPGHGSSVALLEYHDLDGVVVIVQLFLDEERVPAELDSWKVDFSPLQSRLGKLRRPATE